MGGEGGAGDGAAMGESDIDEVQVDGYAEGYGVVKSLLGSVKNRTRRYAMFLRAVKIGGRVIR